MKEITETLSKMVAAQVSRPLSWCSTQHDAGPRQLILRALASSSPWTRQAEGASPQAQVSVYSAHDVTILALLHALESPLAHQASWWPG